MSHNSQLLQPPIRTAQIVTCGQLARPILPTVWGACDPLSELPEGYTVTTKRYTSESRIFHNKTEAGDTTHDRAVWQQLEEPNPIGFHGNITIVNAANRINPTLGFYVFIALFMQTLQRGMLREFSYWCLH